MNELFEVGDHVEVVSLEDEYDPIPPGTRGEVDHVHETYLNGRLFVQVGVKWDNGRSLMACVPPDQLVVLEKAKEATDD